MSKDQAAGILFEIYKSLSDLSCVQMDLSIVLTKTRKMLYAQ